MAKINICSLQLNLKDSDNFEKISLEVDKVLSEGEQTHMIVLSELAVSGVKPDEEKPLSIFLPLFSDLAKKYDTCQKNGLIVRPILDTIALCPSLIISEKEIDELTDKLKKSLQEAKDEIMKVH